MYNFYETPIKKGLTSNTFFFFLSFQIFADSEIKFAGQFIGAIVADTFQNANEAVNLIKVTYSDVEKPQFNLKTIFESGDKSRITKGAEITPTATKSKIIRALFLNY